MAFRRLRTTAAALAALALPVLSAPARAGGAGSTGGVAVKLPAAARPTALGGAFTGLADDLSALLWNPAGLATLQAPEATLMHAPYLADTSFEVLSYGHPLGPIGTIAGSLHLLNYGNLPRTLEQTNGLYGGTFGTSTPQDIFFMTGWGMKLPPVFGLHRLMAGATAKLTFQQLTGGTLVGIGISGGLLWDSPVAGLRVGTLIDNLGALTGEGRLLPIAWTLGGSYGTELTRDLRAAYLVDTKVSVDTSFIASMGLEVTAFDLLAVRGGWRGGGLIGGPTFGAGVKYPLTWFGRTMLWKLDFGSASSGELGTSQRFQFSVQFGGISTSLRLGSIRVSQADGEPVLTWKGKGPGYHVFMRRQDEKDFLQLTDRPVEEPAFPLIGIPPGHYVFRIVTVDPYHPGWRGPESPEVEATLEGAEPAPKR